MSLSNSEIAALFEETADLLELQQANPFRVRAWRNAARVLSGLGREVAQMLAEGKDLDALPGFGKDLAGKVAEIVGSGHCAQLDALRAQVPHGMVELLQLPGLGPHRVQALHEALGIASVEQLREAARQGRVREVAGFGETTEKHLLDAVLARIGTGRRMLISEAATIADGLAKDLASVPGVTRVVAAGSLRRRRETVGDLDLVATAAGMSGAIERFAARAEVERVLAKGPTRASVLLRNGLQVDLRVVADESFGAAWMYFTGSKAHNIALRRRAQDAGLKLNEYGLYREAARLPADTEAAVYRALGLDWIEPELREDRGEIEAAREGRLPHLVERRALRGDLHARPGAAGEAGLHALARAAAAARLAYVAVTDLAGPGGLDAGELSAQGEAIDHLNAQGHGAHLLKGAQVEILEDGSLALPATALAHLDLVLGVVRTGLDLPAARQTDRLRRAMDHKHFSILAHPSGRLLGQDRPGMAMDLERVLKHAHQRGCFVEVNGDPQRLDLDDHGCRMARDAGVLVSIASGAQGPRQLGQIEWALGQGRRGWLEAEHVLNTLALEEVQALLGASMGRGRRAVHRTR